MLEQLLSSTEEVKFLKMIDELNDNRENKVEDNKTVKNRLAIDFPWCRSNNRWVLVLLKAIQKPHQQ